jgi:hypothetical protein
LTCQPHGGALFLVHGCRMLCVIMCAVARLADLTLGSNDMSSAVTNFVDLPRRGRYRIWGSGDCTCMPRIMIMLGPASTSNHEERASTQGLSGRPEV